MIHLKTYNQPTSVYEYIKMMTLQRLSQANVKLELDVPICLEMRLNAIGYYDALVKKDDL